MYTGLVARIHLLNDSLFFAILQLSPVLLCVFSAFIVGLYKMCVYSRYSFVFFLLFYWYYFDFVWADVGFESLAQMDGNKLVFNKHESLHTTSKRKKRIRFVF